MGKSSRFWLGLWVCIALAVFLGLSLGATRSEDPMIIWQLRLPRVILAFAIGAGLSVAGAGLQALFSNPLCDPYTFGISSGAALGAAVGASILGRLAISGGAFGITGCALVGAVVFTVILLGWAKRVGAKTYPLLIAGVALSFLGSSGIAVWMALSDPNGIQGALFWLLGDLSRGTLLWSVLTLASVTGVSLYLLSKKRQLDALLLGDDRAFGLGVSLEKERTQILALISVLVAICVSSAGMIGFVGLAVPHFVRMLKGSLHRDVIPGSFLIGGLVLVVSDLLARTLVRPIELPVGVVTALWGAPVLLWILSSRNSSRGQF